MHRYVESSTIHPLTGQPVGISYRADQLPFDHDNDGVTDEDSDGSGSLVDMTKTMTTMAVLTNSAGRVTLTMTAAKTTLTLTTITMGL
jgi:hypothetical protein